jgi:hypothetical protein
MMPLALSIDWSWIAGVAAFWIAMFLAVLVLFYRDLRSQGISMTDAEVAEDLAPLSSAVTMTRSQRRHAEAIARDWMSPRPEVKS